MGVNRNGHHPLTDLFEFEPTTEIVNIANETSSGSIAERIKEWCSRSDRHIYIGRGSPFGNPYSHLEKSAAKWKVKTREEAIEKYREYILTRPDLLEKLKELRGKLLGCWCKPKLCHGNVLMRLIYESKERLVDEKCPRCGSTKIFVKGKEANFNCQGCGYHWVKLENVSK